MLVTVLSEKNTVINYTHRMISSSQFNIKAFIWQYTYTTINVSYLKLTNNYGANKKIWDIKATNWKKNKSRNLHSQLYSWRTWFPFCMPSGTSFGYMLLLYTVKGKTLVCRNCGGFTHAEEVLLFFFHLFLLVGG